MLSGKAKTGHRVLVLGGGMVGMEAAEFLASNGAACVIVEMLDDVARDMDPISRKLMLKRLEALPVEIHTETELARMDGTRALVRQGGETRDFGRFDTVVAAVGNRREDPLSEALLEAGLTVFRAGDAEEPAQVHDAIISGHRAALRI